MLVCHLAHVAVGVVEVLNGDDVGAEGKRPGRLQPGLLAEDARRDRRVVLLVEHAGDRAEPLVICLCFVLLLLLLLLFA